MLYSCAHMATVGVKGLNLVTYYNAELFRQLSLVHSSLFRAVVTNG